MTALIHGLQRAARAPAFSLTAACAALATSMVVIGVGAPVAAPPIAVLVLACAFLGVSVADETLHPGVLLGLGLVAYDQSLLHATSLDLGLLVVAPWLTFRVACTTAAGPMRRFHGWLPARLPILVWPWPAAWLVLTVAGVAATGALVEGLTPSIVVLGAAVACGAAFGVWSAIPRYSPRADEAGRVALTMTAAVSATVSLSWPAIDGRPDWHCWLVAAVASTFGAAVGAVIARKRSARRLWSRLLPLGLLPASAAWALPAGATAAGLVYGLLGGEGREAGLVVGVAALGLVVAASVVAVPVVWGVEYGVIDWARKRRQRPQPVSGLDLLRAEIVGRPFPRPGEPPHRFFALTKEGRRLTVVLEGAVCLNDRNYVRQDAAQWLCPFRATVEISGRLDPDEPRLVVTESEGAWLRALHAPQDASVTRRAVTLGVRIAAGFLLAYGAAQLVEPRLEPRYSAPCRELFRDPGTLRAPLVSRERCEELLTTR